MPTSPGVVNFPAEVEQAFSQIAAKDSTTANSLRRTATDLILYVQSHPSFSWQGLTSSDLRIPAYNFAVTLAKQKGFTAQVNVIDAYVKKVKPLSELDKPVSQIAGDIKNPLTALFQPNIWLRVGEVALGIILIAVGVARMTNAIPMATKIAKTIK